MSTSCDSELGSSSQCASDAEWDASADLCNELVLAESVFDAAVIVPLAKNQPGIRARAWFWVLLSLLLQSGTCLFLHFQLDSQNTPTPDDSFFDLKNSEGPSLCAWVSTENLNASSMFYTRELTHKALVCVREEILLARNFDLLDIDGDGKWTYAEALQLGQGLSRSKAGLPRMYMELVQLLKDMAQRVPTVKCSVGEAVDAVVTMLDSGNSTWEKETHLPSQPALEVQIARGKRSPATIIGQHGRAMILLKETGKLVKVDAELLFRGGAACRLPKCEDTDYGKTDRDGLPCRWYFPDDSHAQSRSASGVGFVYSRVAQGAYDSKDFNAQEMCCIFGGGTTSVNHTGLDNIPISLALMDFVSVDELGRCNTDPQECLKEHTAIPRWFYEREVAPVMDLCMLLDQDLCGNILHRGAWPDVFPKNKLLSQIRSMLDDNGTIPLFLKISGIKNVEQLRLPHMCEMILQDFCPRLLPDFERWAADRLAMCGQSTAVSGEYGAMFTYSASQLYNGRLGVRSLRFQIFLFWIVVLWTLAMIPEFRQLMLWWEVLTALPRAACIEDCIQGDKESRDDGDKLVLQALPGTRCCLGMTCCIFGILLANTALFVLIYFVGIRYLFIVRSISDLILNSLALAFLITIDDMLFAAFSDAYSKRVVRSSQVKVGNRRGCLRSLFRKCRCLWRFPLGVVLFWPMLLFMGRMFAWQAAAVQEAGDMLGCFCEAAGKPCFTAAALCDASEGLLNTDCRKL